MGVAQIGLKTCGYGVFLTGATEELVDLFPHTTIIKDIVSATSWKDLGSYGGLAIMALGVFCVLAGAAVKWMKANTQIGRRTQADVISTLSSVGTELRLLRTAVQDFHP